MTRRYELQELANGQFRIAVICDRWWRYGLTCKFVDLRADGLEWSMRSKYYHYCLGDEKTATNVFGSLHVRHGNRPPRYEILKD